MREKKKVLRFNKFVVANLYTLQQLKGGTESNPCQADTNGPETEPSPTTDDFSCLPSERYYPSDCTKGQYLSNEDLENCRG